MATPTLRIEELDSGTTYGYVLPAVSRLVLTGYFPTSVVAIARQYLSGKVEDIEEMSDEQIEAWEGFRSHLVAWMVREVEGEGVDLKPAEVDDPDQFPQDDREALYLRAIKMVSAPKAKRAS